MRHTRYVCVKIEMEIPEENISGDSVEEVIDKIISEMDYDFSYEEGDGSIVDMEIMGVQEHVAIGLE